jgi:hypothetical protein
VQNYRGGTASFAACSNSPSGHSETPVNPSDTLRAQSTYSSRRLTDHRVFPDGGLKRVHRRVADILGSIDGLQTSAKAAGSLRRPRGSVAHTMARRARHQNLQEISKKIQDGLQVGFKPDISSAVMHFRVSRQPATRSWWRHRLELMERRIRYV